MRTLLREISVYGSGDLLFKLLAFGAFPIYAHAFSVEEFGIMALAMATAGLISVVANVGMNNAAQRFYWDPATKESTQPIIISTGLAILGLWSCVLVAGLFTTLYPFRDVMDERYGVSWAIVSLALLTVVPEQMLQYALDTLRLHFTPWKYTCLAFLKNAAGVILGLVFVLVLGSGVVGVFAGAFIAAVAAVPVALWFIRKDLKVGFDGEVAGKLIGYGYPFIFAGMAYWVFGSMDRWMLAELSNNTEVGLYSIAFKFATIVLFMNTAFGQAWSPRAMKIRRENGAYRQIFSQILTVWMYFLATAGGAIALFGDELLYLLTPAEYWAAAGVLGVVVMALVLAGTTQITALGISIERRTRLLGTGAWITAVVNLVLNWLLIPHWGALGAGVATFVSYGVLTGFFLFWTQKLHPIPLEKRRLGYCLAVIGTTLVASIYLAQYEPSVGMIAVKILMLGAIAAGGFLCGIVKPSSVQKVLLARRWA